MFNSHFRRTNVPRETVLVVINFSDPKNFDRDRAIPNQSWQVLIIHPFDLGEIISLPKLLQPFAISIFQLENNQSIITKSKLLEKPEHLFP